MNPMDSNYGRIDVDRTAYRPGYYTNTYPNQPVYTAPVERRNDFSWANQPILWWFIGAVMGAGIVYAAYRNTPSETVDTPLVNGESTVEITGIPQPNGGAPTSLNVTIPTS